MMKDDNKQETDWYETENNTLSGLTGHLRKKTTYSPYETMPSCGSCLNYAKETESQGTCTKNNRKIWAFYDRCVFNFRPNIPQLIKDYHGKK